MQGAPRPAPFDESCQGTWNVPGKRWESRPPDVPKKLVVTQTTRRIGRLSRRGHDTREGLKTLPKNPDVRITSEGINSVQPMAEMVTQA
jgi:hypothetical protein